MKKLKKFESFTNNSVFKNLKRFVTGPVHTELGKKIVDKVEKFLKNETGTEVELFQKPSRYNLSEYGDFKMSIGLKIDGEKFLIEVVRKPNWQIVVNNVHYDVSSRTCKNLWYLLDEYEKKSKYKVDKLSKFFL
jgi:hypothetical protein